MIKKYTTKLVTFAIDRTCTSQSQKQGKRFPAYCSCRAYFVVHPAVSKRLQKIMSFPQESAIPTLIHITKSLLKDASYDRLNNLPQFVHILGYDFSLSPMEYITMKHHQFVGFVF